MRRILAVELLAASAAAFLVGCAKEDPLPFLGPPDMKNYDAKLPPGQLALRKITDPKMIPDFAPACGDLAGLRQAIDHSLNYLAKPSSQAHFPYGQITHQQAVDSLKAFAGLLDAGLTPAQINQAVRQRFDVYISVGCDEQGTVLFTGYYTPILRASAERVGPFKYPLYKAPPGLVKLPDGSPAKPMPSRQSIETSDLFAGHELVWLADPFEAYVAHIQGSARLQMTDGRLITVGYAANNGHLYHSVRAELVKDRKIGPRDGLGAMLAYFRAHPDQVQQYTWRNPRFVFFAITEDGRPRGCLNEPVTLWRSIATDKKIFPPACLAFISTSLPRVGPAGTVDQPHQAFVLDQDAGGAIRAAGRCDLYLGIGPAAGELAGRTQNEGKLYYLFVKPTGSPGPGPAPGN